MIKMEANPLLPAITMFSGPLGVVTGIVTALGALMLLIALIQMMTAEDPQAAAAAKHRIIVIIIALFALLFAAAISTVIIEIAKVGIDALYNGKI